MMILFSGFTCPPTIYFKFITVRRLLQSATEFAARLRIDMARFRVWDELSEGAVEMVAE